MTQTITVAIIVGVVFAIILGTQIGVQPEDLEAYEQRCQEIYGMTAVEYYQSTGNKPICNER